MKKTEKSFVSWIDKQVKYYKPYLDINLQNIKIKKADVQYLEIGCTYPYLEPTIKYSQAVFNDWKNGELKKDRILHELLHIITDPLYCKALARYVGKEEIEDERERLTDKLTVILNNLIK